MPIQIHQLVRSDRKTIALIVNQQGQLIVRAPKRVTKEQILKFVEAKQGWIREKQAKMRARLASLPGRYYFNVLSDRFLPQGLLGIAQVVLALGVILLALADSTGWLIAYRVV